MRKRYLTWRTQSGRQLALTLGWTLFAIPDMLWWRDWVSLVSFMSVYAIIISHWTAYIAAKAEEGVESVEQRVD